MAMDQKQEKITLFELAAQLEKKNQPFVLVTVIEAKGSVPGKAGFKLLVQADGKASGTVGGGLLEQHVVKEALQRLANKESGIKTYYLTESPEKQQQVVKGEVIPMMCSGTVTLFYEVHAGLPTIYVFGGGHVGQALLALLEPLGYYRILIDNRENFATPEKNPHASEHILADYEQAASNFQPLKDSFVVILTQGHKYDYHILKQIYQRKLPLTYVGVISSHAKARGLIKQLQKDLGSEVDLSNLYTPIGLDIGGQTASEIALSIAAQIQALRYKKPIVQEASLRLQA